MRLITGHGRGQIGAPMHNERDPAPAEVYEVWASIRSLQANGDLYDWQRADAFRVAEPPMLVGPAAAAHTSTDARSTWIIPGVRQ